MSIRPAISAHRGFLGTRLFADLPELAVGDSFVAMLPDREMTERQSCVKLKERRGKNRKNPEKGTGKGKRKGHVKL